MGRLETHVWLVQLLSLAAAPTFAIMALLSAAHSDAADMLCGSVQGAPLGGMGVMYLLMSAFHLPPWLRLLAGASWLPHASTGAPRTS